MSKEQTEEALLDQINATLRTGAYGICHGCSRYRGYRQRAPVEGDHMTITVPHDADSQPLYCNFVRKGDDCRDVDKWRLVGVCLEEPGPYAKARWITLTYEKF